MNQGRCTECGETIQNFFLKLYPLLKTCNRCEFKKRKNESSQQLVSEKSELSSENLIEQPKKQLQVIKEKPQIKINHIIFQGSPAPYFEPQDIPCNKPQNKSQNKPQNKPQNKLQNQNVNPLYCSRASGTMCSRCLKNTNSKRITAVLFFRENNEWIVLFGYDPKRHGYGPVCGKIKPNECFCMASLRGIAEKFKVAVNPSIRSGSLEPGEVPITPKQLLHSYTRTIRRRIVFFVMIKPISRSVLNRRVYDDLNSNLPSDFKEITRIEKFNLNGFQIENNYAPIADFAGEVLQMLGNHLYK